MKEPPGDSPSGSCMLCWVWGPAERGGGGPGLNYMKGKRASSNMTCNSVKIVLLKGWLFNGMITLFAVKECGHKTLKSKRSWSFPLNQAIKASFHSIKDRWLSG
jgi:hypothetical protein